ncbi:hypothetical protein CKM354_000034400 [Cercospora kikuchii]|uniref:Uncharacterized protein n=1 Tax=Cercospora kikuchii TaxID=84275 RepID=A0A9P3C5U5_9PEZI|nr:uncharacterized protein CKM354_000034400 [Cercospora kikuchii]GIZ36878.1 hypothetical protein CKM354_000034400 [Cercospora kikuchii]
MPDFPKDNIFARSPRTDKLICPMIFVKGGKAVMCGTEFAEAHSGNLFKHIRELHKVIHNSRGIEFFALFKQKSALTLGMPLSKDEMVKLNDVYYEKGIGAVMDMLKERLPMPGYVGSPTSHTKLQQAGPHFENAYDMDTACWPSKVLASPDRYSDKDYAVQFEPKLERIDPTDLPQHFEQVLAQRTVRWPSELLLKPESYGDDVYGKKKHSALHHKGFTYGPPDWEHKVYLRMQTLAWIMLAMGRLSLNLFIAKVIEKRQASHLCKHSKCCIMFGHAEMETEDRVKQRK